MIAIVFSEQVGFWSKFVFWFAIANMVATILFTLVVIVGGFFDLKYLFESLDSDRGDDTDDGRVTGRTHKETSGECDN
jgi:hypothetical protein